MRERVIRHEILDETPYAQAAASLRDLVRINRLLGGHEILRKRIREIVKPDEAFTFLDAGAASGDMGRVVRERHPNATVFSLDYKIEHLRHAAQPKMAADAFQIPFPDRSFDVVFCSLFLHHFPNDQVVKLIEEFRRVARRAVLLTDLERHVLAYYFLPATRWLFGWDPITLHDGPISVEASFKAHELEGLARKAGLMETQVRVHRPAFRVSLVGMV